ncbi:MAG: MXAN_6640 family putative metalloprotease, partial [bacterium]
MKWKYNLKLILIVPLICGCIFVTAYAQETPIQKQQVKELSTAERDNLFLQALSVLPEHRIPVEYRAIIRPVATIKCATMLVAEVQQKYDLFTPEQQSVLRKLLSRPDLPLNYVSASKRFKIHYAVSGPDSVSADDLNNNQIPDYVEETALAFENTYRVEIEDLGYLAPPDDVGEDGPEFDIYIAALRSGVYGLTTRETNFSFIQIDNDFNNGQLTHGIAGAKVTAAHEYFHAVQFGYRNFLTNDEKFYFELCSTWIEDVVFDEINDYYFFLRPFFIYTDTSFNMFDTRGHYYGEAIWNHFLVKRLQDINVVRRTWEIMRS